MNSRRRLSFLLGCAILSIGLMAAGLQRPVLAVEIGRWGTGQFSEKHPGWWWNEGKCSSTAAQDAAGRKPGAKCLHVVNKTPRAPNHFGTTQQAVAITPGQRYQITLWARAKGLASDGGASVAVDEAWKVRPIQLPKGTYDWTRFTGTFSLAANTAQLRILSEDVGEVSIDEVRIEPAPPPAAAVGGAVAAPDPAPDPQGEPEDALWVTAAGGIARTKDAAVAIPEGAAAKPFRLRLHRGPIGQTNVDPKLKVHDARITIEAPEAPLMAKPALVTLSFDGKLPADTDLKRIAPVVHNGMFWEKARGVKIDAAAKRATFEVRWFGATAIATDDAEIQFLYLFGLGGSPYFRDALLALDKTPPFVVEYVPGAAQSPDPEYLRVILEALLKSYQVLVDQMRYDPPAMRPVVVRVRDLNLEEVRKKLSLPAGTVGTFSPVGFDLGIVSGVGEILVDSRKMIPILIDSNVRDRSWLRAAVAHEFFHLLQSTILARYRVQPELVRLAMASDLQWLTEASAEWAADAVFDDLNGYFLFLATERDYTFKGTIRSSRDGAPPQHPYAGAAFLKFLAWRYGKDFVRQAWLLAWTEVDRKGHKETLIRSSDILAAACGRLQTYDRRKVDLETNVATFALYYNFLRNLGESSQWFRDKGANRWLLDSVPHMQRSSLKAKSKGSLDLGKVQPLGTGPLLRLDHDKSKPLELTVRLKPQGGFAAPADTGMLLVVFADEQRILQTRPFSGAGGAVKAAAKTASHVVVIPLNLHYSMEFPIALEWRSRRDPADEVYVRGPMQVFQHKFAPDTPWAITASQTSAVMTYTNPKTGRKDSIKFTWDLPPEKIGRFERPPIQVAGTFQAPPKPKPPNPVPKPSPPKPTPIETRRTYVPGKPERPIILTDRDEGTGWIDPDHWSACCRLFIVGLPQQSAALPRQVPAYLKDDKNFPGLFAEQSDFSPRERLGGMALLDFGIMFWDTQAGTGRKRYSLRLPVDDDRPVARVGFYLKGERGLVPRVVQHTAAVFWDYTLEQEPVK